jgi:hypothetical protein
MTRLLLTFLIYFSTTSFGQSATDISKRAQNFQDSLAKNKVDTLLDYTFKCVGYYHIDTCNFFDAHYIFWKQNDKTYLQKIDDCNTYKTILLDTTNPLTFYIAQKKKVDQEIIYPPTYVQSQHGDTGTLIQQSIDHTCYYEMTFLINTKKKFKRVSDYDLRYKSFDNGRKNMYYTYNQKTQLKELIEKIDQLIKQLDTNKNFQVQ